MLRNRWAPQVPVLLLHTCTIVWTKAKEPVLEVAKPHTLRRPVVPRLHVFVVDPYPAQWAVVDPARPTENVFLIFLDAHGHWSHHAIYTLVITDHQSHAINRMLKIENISLGCYLKISLTAFGAPDGTTYWGQLNFNTATNLYFFHMSLEWCYIVILT